jgi:2-dehydropantoate 2-reductase
MRVLVVGAGAVGSFLGWAVAAGGGEVTLVRRGFDGTPGARVALRVVRPDGTESPVEVGLVGAVADAATPDLVIVAVRQYDLPAALESLAALPDVPLLTAQNGVGAEETTAAARPGGTLLAASVTASVEREPDGSVRWLRRGGIALAPVRGDADALIERLGTTFRAAGVEVATHRDAPAMKWSKVIANLVANATSGLLDQDPPSIYADPALFAVEREQLREALAVMRARHLRPVSLPGAPVPLLALATTLPAPLARAALRRVVGSARGGKDPSLRGAVQLGGPTEAGWLNGAVARAGAELGVSTPVNSALASLVEQAATDPERRAWFRHRPDRLLEALGRS